MIVRDEAHVIERCLRSVRPLISSWVICDTGSTDGTPELIERALDGVPGTLHHCPWRNFGENRTEALELARGTADYLLLVDADMTLRALGELPRPDADAYLLRHDEPVSYAVPRLVRADIPWRYEGMTHELLVADVELGTTLLEQLVVEHHADGSSHEEKLERDRALLEDELIRQPDHPRTVFYLAQTLNGLGEKERALELYRRRAGLGGNEQEAFYAALQAGTLLALDGDDEASAALLEAWSLRPSRAEPLYELACFHLEREAYDLAYVFASRGLEVPFPDDTHFVHRDVYEWGLRSALAVAAYWTGRTQEALELTEHLLAQESLPPTARLEQWENRAFCLTALGQEPGPSPWDGLLKEPLHLSEVDPGMVSGQIALDVSPPWPQFNTTIAADGDGYRLLVRTASYEIDEGRYLSLAGDDLIRTLNYDVRLDRELGFAGVQPIVDRSDSSTRVPSRIGGYEDLRLFEVGGSWFATATVRDRNVRGNCEIALLRLDGPEIHDVSVLRSPRPGRHEKNWMPFVRDGELHFLYLCDPLTVLACDPGTGRLEKVVEETREVLPIELRGGSQGLSVDGGWLFAVHEVTMEGRIRDYAHRLVLLDADLRLAGLSPAFKFIGRAIEFCCGLAAHGDDLLFSLGADDREAWLVRASRTAMLGLIEPVPESG